MLARLKAALGSFEGTLSYVKARVIEKSTWAGIIGGFSGASALQHPWDYLSAIGGAIMVLIPTKAGQDQSENK